MTRLPLVALLAVSALAPTADAQITLSPFGWTGMMGGAVAFRRSPRRRPRARSRRAASRSPRRRPPMRALLVVAALALSAPVRAQLACPEPLPAPFGYDASTPLAVTDSLLSVEDGVELWAFSFDSPAGGRATGVLAVPLAAGPHAGILNLTGFPVRPEPARAYAATLARRGAVVALLWSPPVRPDGHGDGSPLTLTPADSAGQVQYVVDARRTLDLLAARPDVDPARLGLVGGSHGGALGALVAGVEPRIRAAALRSADGGAVSYVTDPSGPGRPDDVSEAEWDRWIAAMSAIEPACYVGRATAHLLFLWGRQDRLVSAARAADLTARLPEGAEVRWYDAGHQLNEQAEADRLAWLDRHLGTRPPTSGEHTGH